LTKRTLESKADFGSNHRSNIMTSRVQKTQGFQMCAFSEDLEEVKEFRVLLRENNISSLIKRKTLSGNVPGYAVFVPEDDVDEAQVILESHSAFSDFYELAFEDEAQREVDENEYDF
jgi:hypothetical protein